jgi:hypothetical protein
VIPELHDQKDGSIVSNEMVQCHISSSRSVRILTQSFLASEADERLTAGSLQCPSLTHLDFSLWEIVKGLPRMQNY